MSIWERLFGGQGVQASDDPEEAVVGAVKKHLKAMHKRFRFSGTYQASAPYWKELEDAGVLSWLNQCFLNAVGKPGIITQTTRKHDGLLVCTVLQSIDPGEIRCAFAPAGYLSHLEAHGFFDAPQQRMPAAAFVLGHDGNRIRVHVTWFPPLDGRAFTAIASKSAAVLQGA